MRLPHLFLVVLITLLWGMNFVAVAHIVRDFPPILANALRFGVVLVLLLPYLRRVPGQMSILLAIAFLMGVAHFGSMFLAMAIATDIAPIAIVAQVTVPLSTLLAVLVLGERIGPWRISGLMLSFSGVLIFGLDPAGMSQTNAIALIVFSALVYSIVAILMRRIKGAAPMTVQAWIAMAAVPGSLLLTLGLESGQWAALSGASWQSYGLIAYSALAASIIGHGGVYYLYQRYPVSTVSPFLLLAPVWAVLGAVVVMGEQLDWRDLLGGALTLAGVLIVTIRTRDPRLIETAEKI